MAVDFPYLDVSNCNASVKVAQNGAQIFAFDRVGEAPVIWVSPQAVYRKGHPLRGGIPVCWPWFGDHPHDTDKPRHGFARIMPWELEEFSESDRGVTVSSFSLSHSKETLELWPHRFRLTLSVEVSKALVVRLTTMNCDEAPFEITQALHSYFLVGDIEGVEIQGLEGAEFVDRLTGERREGHHDSVVIRSEMDRIYRHQGDCRLVDKRLGRVISVGKRGSRSTVVWNPWRQKAAKMPDFPDDGYRNMVCIGAANLLDDKLILEPGQEHTLEQRIEVHPI